MVTNKMKAAMVFFLASSLVLSGCTKTREGRMKKDTPTPDSKVTDTSANGNGAQPPAPTAVSPEAAANNGDIQSKQDLCAMPKDLVVGGSVMDRATAIKTIKGVFKAEKVLVFQATFSGQRDQAETPTTLLRTLSASSVISVKEDQTTAQTAVTCDKMLENEATRLNEASITVSALPYVLNFDANNLSLKESSEAASMNAKIASDRSQKEAVLSFADADSKESIENALDKIVVNSIEGKTIVKRFELSEDKKTLKLSFSVLSENEEQANKDYKDAISLVVIYSLQ